MLIARLVLAIVALSAAAPTLGAPALPPDPDALAIVHEDAEGRRSPLLDPRGLPVYDDLGHGLEPTITIERIDAMGYDLVFDFENETLQPRSLGRIDIGVITLGTEFRWLNLNRACEFVQSDRRTFSAQIRPYPGSLYAPVGVLMNDDFAVGVSLLYDLLQDRHDVTVRLAKPGGVYGSGPGGAGYSVGFDLGNPRSGTGYLVNPGSLWPGERRQYRVAVRAVKLDRPMTAGGAQDWLAAIEPYRDHFEHLYGGVAYERDTRPVRGRPIAGPHAISEANPMGFNGTGRLRPDLVGFGPLVNALLRPSGFERTMLWSPGGLYFNNRDLNYPSRFMSQLTTTDALRSAFDARVGLPRLAASGQDIGLWWGRSTRVARTWDSPSWQPLDLGHPDRIDLALQEMQLAHDAGATMIGLDAFVSTEMPAWQQYEWLLELRRRYPETTFIIEPITCDVLHTLGPTFDPTWRADDRTGRDDDRFSLRNPHYLADYLLPGHEIWGHFRYDHSRVTANETRVQRDAQYIASHGYVPVLATSFVLTNPGNAVADASWLRTVPESLKTDAHRRGTPGSLPIPPADAGGDPSDGNGSGDDNASLDDFETRPLMLPNGRVIRVPVYGTRK